MRSNDARFTRTLPRRLASSLHGNSLARHARSVPLNAGVSRTGMKIWVLPYRELRRLHGRAYRAQQRDHSEVAGLLVSGMRQRLALAFLPNHAGRPGSFLLNPEEVARERRKAKARGKRIVGLFHSHPLSRATLGPGDRRGATLNWLQLVYDVCGREARLWRVYRRLGRRRVASIPLRVVRSDGRGAN
jgi:proteasome lid subunit RPN8/RPN11